MLPSEKQLITDFGERLRLARLRRRFSVELVAERSGISRMTLYRVEHGSPAVSFGVYLRVLAVLNLESDIAALAADDRLGRQLQDVGLPVKQRVRKPRPQQCEGGQS